MALLHRLTGGLRALLRRRDVERDLDDEVRAYLDTAIERNLAAGMTRAEAERSARAAIGSLEAVKDQTREVGWEFAVETTWRDVRYAARTLRRTPGFAAIAVITLAIGIGANTAIFSVVNALMLRPLPVDRPDELVALAAVYGDTTEAAFSYAAYRQFATEGAAVIDPVAVSRADRVAMTMDRVTDTVMHKRVSGNYFTVLGVPPAAGRTLRDTDDRLPRGEPVAIISHAYWTSRLGRDAGVVGRQLRLNGMAYTVVGVAHQGFVSESAGEAPDVWTPLTAQATPSWVWTGHSTTWLRILARRRPGISLEQAQARLEPVYGRIRTEMAAGTGQPEYRQAVLDSRFALAAASGGTPRLRDNFARPLQILMAIVGLVLIIACANVASLVLARSAARRRELAVCLAIGAARLRLVRQLLAEALLLAACGSAVGLLLAFWGTSALAALASRTALSISIDLRPDLRVLAFTIVIACAAAVIFGLLPALRSARLDPLETLKHAGVSNGSIMRLPLGRTLIVTQIAVSVVLLVTAGLFTRSLMKLNDVDTGFDTDQVLVLMLTPLVEEAPVAPAARRDLYRRLLTRAETVPGVRAASVSFTGLFNEGTWGNAITVEGFTAPSEARPRTFANAVSHRYFEVVGLDVVSGRGFSIRDDEAAPRVAVINRSFAQRFFGGDDPVGRHVGFGTPAKEMMEVVGVIEDAKYVELRERDRPMLYVPFTQLDQNLRSMEVRTAGPPSAVAARLRQELSAVDPRVAVVAAVELREQVDASIVTERLIARLSAGFGLVALVLSAIGLYGLTAYVTAQRTGEIGIRMALGGDRRAVRWLIVRDVLLLVATGAAIGLPLALGAARLMESQLYEVGPADPAALIASVATLALAALLAGYAPARRAARVDPLIALRCE
jgi:predicted permease